FICELLGHVKNMCGLRRKYQPAIAPFHPGISCKLFVQPLADSVKLAACTLNEAIGHSVLIFQQCVKDMLRLKALMPAPQGHCLRRLNGRFRLVGEILEVHDCPFSKNYVTKRYGIEKDVSQVVGDNRYGVGCQCPSC